MAQYKLNVNAVQAILMVEAMDLYVCMGIGRLEALVCHPAIKSTIGGNLQETNSLIRRLKMDIFSLPETDGFSIYEFDKVPDRIRQAHDFYRMMSYRLANDAYDAGKPITTSWLLIESIERPERASIEQPFPLVTKLSDNFDYEITLTRTQAELVVSVMDFYARIALGQFESMLLQGPVWRHFRGLDAPATIERCLDRLKLIIFGLPSNASLAIGGAQTIDPARQAYDIECVIRHRLAWDKKGNPTQRTSDMFTANFDTPRQWSTEQPLPTIRQTDLGLIDTLEARIAEHKALGIVHGDGDSQRGMIAHRTDGA